MVGTGDDRALFERRDPRRPVGPGQLGDGVVIAVDDQALDLRQLDAHVAEPGTARRHREGDDHLLRDRARPGS